MANRTLLWYLVEDMIGQGRAALSVGEKKFLLDLSHRQLDQYQDPQSSYYQAFLVFRMLQDFAGLRRLANLLEDDNVHKRQALLMLEDYEQAFGSFDRQLRQNPERLLALDFAFHGMYPALFQRIDDFATSRGFPKPSVFAADRTAANLQQLASSYDLAIAIAKGGLSSGGVAEFLNIPVKVIDVHAHGREKPLSSFVDAIRPEDVAGKRILFMDKDMVTGASIREALRLIEAYKPGAVGAYFNHPLSDLVDPKAARELRDRGIALHFPNEIEAPSTLALFYHAHEKLDTPLGRFRKAGRKLEELAGKKKVRDYLNRQQRAFFAFNPDLPGVEGLRGMIANRLETLAESYSQVRIVSRSQAQTFLDRVLQHDTTLPPTYAAELANARYHPRAVEAAERRGVQNFHQPHSYLAAFRSAQQAAKEKYEVALIVGPEGFAYEPIFRDLGLKTVAVNIPEADFNGERSIATFENLSALRRRKVLVVEDDVQSGATLRRLLAEISPFQPGFLGLYLGLPPSRQKVENIPPAFKRIHLTEEQHPSDDAAFLKHLKKREPVFKSHSHR